MSGLVSCGWLNSDHTKHLGMKKCDAYILPDQLKSPDIDEVMRYTEAGRLTRMAQLSALCSYSAMTGIEKLRLHWAVVST